MDNQIFNKKACEQMAYDSVMFYKNQFTENAISIYELHLNQKKEDVERLNAKYDKHSFFGDKSVYECLEMLALVVDPSDTELFTTNQLIHSLQVAEMMENDGLNEEWVVAGLVHDLGKILLLIDEPAENVVGPNQFISKRNEDLGLNNLIFSWNHDEYIYKKLGRFFRPEISMILRYHSIRFENCRDLMLEQDLRWINEYLLEFRKYDLNSKSVYYYPKKTLKDYKKLLDDFFPLRVDF